MFSGSCSQGPGSVEITGPVDHPLAIRGVAKAAAVVQHVVAQLKLSRLQAISKYVGRIGGKQGFDEFAGGVLLPADVAGPCRTTHMQRAAAGIDREQRAAALWADFPADLVLCMVFELYFY